MQSDFWTLREVFGQQTPVLRAQRGGNSRPGTFLSVWVSTYPATASYSIFLPCLLIPIRFPIFPRRSEEHLFATVTAHLCSGSSRLTSLKKPTKPNLIWSKTIARDWEVEISTTGCTNGNERRLQFVILGHYKGKTWKTLQEECAVEV